MLMSAQVVRSTVVSEKEWLVLQVLSSEQRQQMFDFAEFLVGRRDQSDSPNQLKGSEDEEKIVLSIPPRIFGLHAGQAVMSDDFDDPMPDEFWFGHPDPLIISDDKISEFNQRSVSE
jgi:hypothetical protein